MSTSKPPELFWNVTGCGDGRLMLSFAVGSMEMSFSMSPADAVDFGQELLEVAEEAEAEAAHDPT